MVDLLNEVFRFKHARPSDRQDVATCRGLVALFQRFVGEIQPIDVDGFTLSHHDPLSDDRVIPAAIFTTAERDKLELVCTRLVHAHIGNIMPRRGDVWIERWLPEYGCALQLEMATAVTLRTKLVYADGWERVLHFLPDGKCIHSAVAKCEGRVLNCGDADVSNKTELLAALEEELVMAKTRKGQLRSAAGNKLGHQKTPQFAAALVRTAVANVGEQDFGIKRTAEQGSVPQEDAVPRGGMTDVGQHTGGRPRDTCWPIVRACIHHFLPHDGGLFAKTLVRFKLMLVQEKLAKVELPSDRGISEVKGLCDTVDDVFFMLDSVVKHAVNLVELGYDVSGLQTECDAVRSRIGELLRNQNQAVATQYRFPEALSERLEEGSALPKFADLPWPGIVGNIDGQKLADVRDSALNNLNGCTLVDGDSCGIDALYQWAVEEATKPVESFERVLMLRSVERFMLQKALELDTVRSLDESLLPGTVRKLSQLYKTCSQQWREQPNSGGVLQAEQRSRELLVLWIATCLLHRWCAARSDLFAEYDIALRWTDLAVAVLSDFAAITALQQVARYIRSWNGKRRGPLFHLTDQGATMDFALRFGSADPELECLYATKQAEWKEYVASKWAHILVLKSAADTVRNEISGLKGELKELQEQLEDQKDELTGVYDDDAWVRRMIKASNGRIRHVTNMLRQKKEKLTRCLVMPPFLVRPLPGTMHEALQVLFFLNMPSHFEVYGDLCLMAQRSLGPDELTHKPTQSCGSTGESWLTFYTQRTPSSYTFQAGPFALRMGNISIPGHWGPRSVDHVASKKKYAAECVWSPKISDSHVTWTDWSGVQIDPFAALSMSTVQKNYTEGLPGAFSSLKWMNAPPGGNSRGNMAYASLNQRPSEFEKGAFVALGSLRAFPNQQIRKLVCALRENAVPWANPCVGIIVKQLLYQIGDLSDKTLPQCVWKTDLMRDEGLSAFCAALNDVVESLEQTPREWESAPLLGEIASFVHQFTDKARPIARKLTTMTRRWAEEIMAGASGQRSSVTHLRVKECILYGSALVPFGLGPLTDKDKREICEVIVLFKNSLLFASIDRSRDAEVSRMQKRVSELMARRLVEVDMYAGDVGGDELLNTLLHLVDPTTQPNLTWERLQSREAERLLGCFEAYDGQTKTHYAINLGNGSVLINGIQPGGLPACIRNHDTFRTLFGRNDFEVTNRCGFFRTIREHHSRHYGFMTTADGELVVQELQIGDGGITHMTLHLCLPTWLQAFGNAFPVRLQVLYTHWYWEERKCVLLRPKVASDRRVSFVVAYSAPTADGYLCACYRVPLSDTGLPYSTIWARLQQYDSFAETGKSLDDVLGVLSKLEMKAYIHLLRTPQAQLKIELPRFSLHFQLTSGKRFRSVEYKGYVLSSTQQFDDFLPRFSRYLVLELGDAGDTSRPNIRLLVPGGRVTEGSGGMVDVDVRRGGAVLEIPREADEADLPHPVVSYTEHRRLKTFEAETVETRLQLTAIYVRAGTSVPSERLGMTGAEAALQMLRACFPSKPFSNTEREFLASICQLSYRAPAAKIMAAEMLARSEQLAFLFEQKPRQSFVISCTNEKDEYASMRMHKSPWTSLRWCLSDEEERAFLGHVWRPAATVIDTELVDMEPPLHDASFVGRIEEKLATLSSCPHPADAPIPKLPLRQQHNNTMNSAMMAELEASWNSYHSQPTQTVMASPTLVFQVCSKLLKDVSNERSNLEGYLRRSYNRTLADKRSQLLRIVNRVPSLTLHDVLHCAVDDRMLHLLMPNLRLQSRVTFKNAVLHFMELCVLEDKLERIVLRAKRTRGATVSGIANEWGAVRTWKSNEFPFWLAFEVEGRLQIRREQFVVARHLIENPGSVCQLNMGRGKTRVILPMLFLYISHQQRCSGKIARAHFLGSLLSEARHFMHRYLTASSAGLRILELPFHRNIELGVRELALMQDVLEDAKTNGSILLVAPEHRMSLELKRLEIASSGNEQQLVQTIDMILDSTQYVDILDECDALLHHRYHLVYAVGAPSSLSNGDERWLAAEALLRVVTCKGDSRVSHMLASQNFASSQPEYLSRRGAYDGTRLIPGGERSDEMLRNLKEALVLDLIAQAPFDLEWIRTFSEKDQETRCALINVLTDPIVDFEEAVKGYEVIFGPYEQHLLALRGLVAFGILEHCLEKRYRVDYGLPDVGTRQKRLAIPFRAADVAAERSEFSHPDVCIVLTLLSYYHAGLRESELRSALEMLVRLDLSEQVELYSGWYNSVECRLTEQEQATLCDVRHISLADVCQFQMLFDVYRFSKEVINFFLRVCVFPKDTHQYPKRLSRTAWNIAGGSNNIGFSGTNDNHRLLPLSVVQREPDEPSLRGTNGKMLNLILSATEGFKVVRQEKHTDIPWQSVLRFAVAKCVQAVVDTGALLAGVVTRRAAEFVAQEVDFAYSGVTYFDSHADWDCWMVLEKTHRHVIPLQMSSIPERDTLVLFDEARTRGSDMKLPPDAVAVLTLGPRLTKDKLMQGAGRMRQLGSNQRLWITCFEEVAQSILHTCRLDSVGDIATADVLDWVMDNTKSEAVHGLLQWAENGLHFTKTREDPEAEAVEEHWSLEKLYRAAHNSEKIADIVITKAEDRFGDAADVSRPTVNAICRRATSFGMDDEVYVTSHTDECERELQLEEEREHEREQELVQCVPEKELPWEYEKVLDAQSARGVTATTITRLGTYMKNSVAPKELGQLAWKAVNVFGTAAFFATVKARRELQRGNEFLRVVDAMLLFEDQSVLLLSEMEADHILQLLWRRRSTGLGACVHFLNLPLVREAMNHVESQIPSGSVPLALGSKAPRDLCLTDVTAMELFEGKTMWPCAQHAIVESTLQTLLRPLARREEVLNDFVCSRGNSHRWNRSFLHSICRRMDVADCVTRGEREQDK